MSANRRAYAAHDVLVAPARHHPEIWRLLLGLLVVALVAFALNAILQALVITVAPDFWSAEFVGFEGQGNRPLSLLIILGSFAFIAIGVAVAARLFQRRAPLGLFGPFRVALIQFWRVCKVLLLVGVAIVLLPPWDMGASELIANLPFATWLLLLPLSLVAVLIQAATEELLFRGYLQQTLAARFNHPALWMGVPAVLFAAGHYTPAEAGENAVLIALWAGMFGLMMADLTARAGTLGPAIAVHLLNNVTALLFVSLPDSLSGLALYTVPYSMSDTEQLRDWLAVDFAIMVVGWLAARVAIAR